MALDPASNNLRDVARERPTALPTGEILTVPGLVEQLQISDKKALEPGNLVPFLASQSVRLKAITEMEEIKSLYAAIPEYVYSENMPMVSALSSDEQTALKEWNQERSALLQSQSGDADLKALQEEIETYIDGAIKNNPDMFAPEGAGATVDVLGDMIASNMVLETEETKKKYQELLAVAASSGNAEDVLLAMTFRHAASAQLKMGKLMEGYKAHMDSLDKLQAEMELSDFKNKGAPSQADMLKFNMEFARSSGDANTLMQMIMKTMGEYERTMQSASSMNKSMGEPLANTIRNMKS